MSFYVYKFLNENSEIIYVGQSINLEQRIENQHFTPSGHLPRECYNETKKVLYGQLNTKLDMDLMEIYLIGKYRPKYNTTYNRYDVTLSIDEPNWTEYDKELKYKAHIVREILEKHRQIEKSLIQEGNKLIEKNNIDIKTIDLNEEIHIKVEDVKEQNIEILENEIIEEPEEIKKENDIIYKEKSIYNNLGSALIKYGLSQSELGKKTGSSRATISNIVRGVYTPGLNLALRISEVFQLPVQDIFYLDEK